MARRKTLSDVGVSNLKPRATRYYVVADPELPGHYIRVMPSGLMSYVAVTRSPGGKQVWATVGSTSLVGIDEAREKAREAIKAIKAGGTGRDRTPSRRPRKIGLSGMSKRRGFALKSRSSAA